MREVRRRDFLKGGVASIAAASGIAALSEMQPVKAASGNPVFKYPKLDIAPLKSILPGTEISFDYPDENSPALLIRMGEPAEGGVGPGEDIVGYSILCTHKGCAVNYIGERKMMVCPCHWSAFDPAKSGRLVIGQASQSLPQMALDIRDGMVRAVGVAGLIYGRHTNIL
ncbi:MAG: arsenate reductase (azurin) small subunit [Rhodospirillaceae bacterium TMED8]|nr:arsenate reductase (azurin) small subunit [Magnetovibrio sp.]OUT52199.1 MAG: arsenate reductase (azurin) small subunit [Rhodospirillaceae bacterium TMED8]|tara:strand:- start:2817 stop:3323 length:507 start_codon:yes stop_codon:yes gene_type:complete